jgi:hypothetical protein
MKPYLAIVKEMNETREGVQHAYAEFGSSIHVPMYNEDGSFKQWGTVGVDNGNLVVGTDISDELFHSMEPMRTFISAKFNPQVEPVPTIFSCGPKQVDYGERGTYLHHLGIGSDVTELVYNSLNQVNLFSEVNPSDISYLGAKAWQKTNRFRVQKLYDVSHGKINIKSMNISEQEKVLMDIITGGKFSEDLERILSQ